MFEKGLPKKFWAEAVNTTVYLFNRLPTNALEEKTSFEAWYGFKPSMSHLRIFSSVCHVHVPDVKRVKLDEKSEIGVLVGYSSNAKGYRIYMPHNNKVTVHRDVKVDEQASWNWEDEVVTPKQKFLKLKDPQEQDVTIDEPENLVEYYDSVEIEGGQKIRMLANIYEQCNVTILEPSSYEEAAKDYGWRQVMQEELEMIHRNQTWGSCGQAI